MPLYEYRCQECGTTIEVRQKFSDEPLTLHEGCGGALEKLISRSSLHFKGTGWYVTDYGRGGKLPPANGSNGKSESKAETKSEPKTESKSAGNTESKSESKPAPAGAGAKP